MREIKFRAWIKKDSFMMNNHLLSCMSYEEVFKRQDTVTLMQYTGLKDKNGVEIYEGDIVSEPCHDCKDGVMISEIVFEGGCFVKKEGFHGHMTHTILYGEVIGNIYENPELLKND